MGPLFNEEGRLEIGMGDILQTIEGSSVTFSPSTARADAWMQERGYAGNALFSLPADRDIILRFKAQAEAAGLEVSVP